MIDMIEFLNYQWLVNFCQISQKLIIIGNYELIDS